MRLTSMLSATMVAIYFAACSATADFDQTKVSMNGSPVHSHDSTGRRLLRTHQENEAEDEERTPNFNVIGLTKKKEAKKLADKLMADNDLAQAAYRYWKSNGHTLTHIDDFLKLASSKAKYNQLYNGYALRTGLGGY